MLACSTLVPTEVLVDIDADSISRDRGRQRHLLVVSREGLTRLDRLATLVGNPTEIKLPTTVMATTTSLSEMSATIDRRPPQAQARTSTK